MRGNLPLPGSAVALLLLAGCFPEVVFGPRAAIAGRPATVIACLSAAAPTFIRPGEEFWSREDTYRRGNWSFGVRRPDAVFAGPQAGQEGDARWSVSIQQATDTEMDAHYSEERRPWGGLRHWDAEVLPALRRCSGNVRVLPRPSNGRPGECDPLFPARDCVARDGRLVPGPSGGAVDAEYVARIRCVATRRDTGADCS